MGEYLSDGVFVVLVAGEQIEVCDVADGLEAAGDQMGLQGQQLAEHLLHGEVFVFGVECKGGEGNVVMCELCLQVDRQVGHVVFQEDQVVAWRVGDYVLLGFVFQDEAVQAFYVV